MVAGLWQYNLGIFFIILNYVFSLNSTTTASVHNCIEDFFQASLMLLSFYKKFLAVDFALNLLFSLIALAIQFQ
jgi:hypothetical protein